MNIYNLGTNYVREHLNTKPKNGLNLFNELVKKVKQEPLETPEVHFRNELETCTIQELKHIAVLYRGLKTQNSFSVAQQTLCEKISKTASLLVFKRKNLINQALYQGFKMSPHSWDKEIVKHLITEVNKLDEEEVRSMSKLWLGIGHWMGDKSLSEIGFTGKEEIKSYCKLMGENLKTLSMDISNICATDLGEIVTWCSNIESLILRREILEVLKVGPTPYDFSDIFDQVGSLKKLKVFKLYGHGYASYIFPRYTGTSETFSRLCKSDSIESIEFARMVMAKKNSFFDGLLNLKTLKSLKLIDCRIFNNDFFAFKNHTTLETLILEKCFIKDYSGIKTEHLEKVKELTIKYHASLVENCLETFKKCKNLQKLSVATDEEENLRFLVGFKDLKELIIKTRSSAAPVSITKKGLKSLELVKDTLEVLDINAVTIDECSVEDLILCFEKFQKLKSLRIPFRDNKKGINITTTLRVKLEKRGILFRNK